MEKLGADNSAVLHRAEKFNIRVHSRSFAVEFMQKQEPGDFFHSEFLPELSVAACLWAVIDGSGNQLLKGVSRSFYLSLRLLPKPMRGAASLGYLLARASDTLADTVGAPVEARLLCLDWFDRSLSGEEDPPRWPIPVLNAVTEPMERRLLESTGDLFAWLDRLPPEEAALVREVVGIIIGGQRLDLERFAMADGEHPVALEDEETLEDYAWRVAGCVGAFWTKLGFLTLSNTFSWEREEVMLSRGIAYGKGLQLVNILRDLPADLANGRCYLPVSDPHDLDRLMDVHRQWVERAAVWLESGFSYASTLKSRKLRAASVLPAMIGVDTLDRLKGADWPALERRIRTPRSRVYLAMWRALTGNTEFYPDRRA
jgi:farnesyl-diphosphate farnesyltransferase